MTTIYQHSASQSRAINKPFLKPKIVRVIDKVIEEEEETSIKYLF